MGLLLQFPVASVLLDFMTFSFIYVAAFKWFVL